VLTDIARSAELSRNTARDYLTYLDIVFLTAEISPWSTNLTSRLTKAPKVYLTDSGLAASPTPAWPRTCSGCLPRTCVVPAIPRSAPWSRHSW